MKINDIRRVIRNEVQKKGYGLEERQSVSTNSWYFKIYSGDTSLMFRVADHRTKTDVITLRVDKNFSTQSVIGFVRNRCQDLSNRRLRMLLGM